MKHTGLLTGLIGAALFTLVMAAPASAQVYFGAGPGGVGVGVGVGDPYYNDYRWRHRHWRGEYASDCRVVRERIVRPNGRVIHRTRQICD